MISTGNVPQRDIEDIRDNLLSQAYKNLNIPVLFDTYRLGVAIGGAESQATTMTMVHVPSSKAMQVQPQPLRTAFLTIPHYESLLMSAASLTT